MLTLFSTVLRLRQPTPEEWVHAVLSDFESFLLDHAACERKASATALTLALHYRDRRELVSSMIELAREELEHFHTIYKEMEKRGVQLAADTKDAYVNRMRQGLRKQPDLYFLDRLLVASVVEARGCERFRLLSLALPAGRLKELYSRLSQVEAHHHQLFLRLAKVYFDSADVDHRLAELLDIEAEILSQLPLRAALH